MAGTSTPEPVKYFVALLWANAAALPEVYARLVERFGAIDFEGPDRAFDLTNYYEAEMGANLFRRLVAFESLRGPEELVEAKLACNAIEDALAPFGARITEQHLPPGRILELIGQVPAG